MSQMDEEEDDLDIIDNDDKDNQSIFKQFPNTKMQEEKNKDSEEEDDFKKLTIEPIQSKKNKSFHSKKEPNAWYIFEDYDAMLSLTDISYGVKGSNKYYKIQLHQKNNKDFRIFFEWGRVGAQNPNTKNEDYDNKIDAIITFKKKFSDKTHNDWKDRFNFKQKPGKYTLIKTQKGNQVDNKSVNEEIERLNKRNNLIQQKMQQYQSKLPPQIRILLERIWDLNRIKKTLKELNFDTEKNPLGKLQYEQIQKGYQILSEISQSLNKNQGRDDTIVELSNQFYTNIPQNYGYNKPPLINHIQKVKEKMHLLDVLKEMDVTNRYLNLIEKDQTDRNPLDFFFDTLKIEIQIVNKNDKIYDIISKSLTESHGPTHDKYQIKLENIFQVTRYGEEERYLPFKRLQNKKLLWHGSRTENYVGILSDGLRIATPDAPVSGYMFGKGLYFADVPSKSANYCYPKEEQPTGILLLCEVALGNEFNQYKAKNYKKPPKYYHSVRGVGKYQFKENDKVMLENNLQFYNGQVKEFIQIDQPVELKYNEYVVYDTSQVRIRYVVQIQFKFSQN